MTDPLTDAVRRIKDLQEDVERLKSGQDEEGESRLLFSVQEQGVAADTLAVVSSDISAAEAALADDAITIVEADVAQSEAAVADDQQEDLRARQLDTVGAYNQSGYNTSSYNE